MTNSYIKPNSLILGDCLEVMKDIESESIDLILADLPYGTTNAKWDKPIDLNLLWIQYERIIKRSGCILLFAQSPFDKILACSNLKMFRYEWIWEKTEATGHFNAKKMPMKAHENILVFYNSLPTYNPQKTQGHKPINSYTKRANVANKTELYGKSSKDISGGGETDRFPRDVIKFKSDKQKNKLNGNIHSTQKPLALCEYMIKTYSNPGDMVLDNVMGSGQTIIAAKANNRKYIGIEKESSFFNLAQSRINQL